MFRTEWDETKCSRKVTKSAESYIYIAPLHLHDRIIITLSINVRNLEAIFDSEMAMFDHVNSATRTCFYQLRQLSLLQRSLSADPAKMLVHAFVSNRVN